MENQRESRLFYVAFLCVYLFMWPVYSVVIV